MKEERLFWRRRVMRRSWLNFAIVLCAIAGVSAGARAQVPKSTVAKSKPGGMDGVVVNAKGAPVAGAQVLWQVADGERPHVLHSDVHGKFHLSGLRPAYYDLRASASGTWSAWEHNILVRPGDDAAVTLRLTSKQPPVAVGVELKGVMRTWDLPVPGAVPHDSAVDLKGMIWFTLQETGHLARFNPDTHEWKLFKVPTEDSGPHGLVVDVANNIWFTENYAGKIGRLDPKSGKIEEFIPPIAKDPHTPVIGPNGAVWFTAQNANVIGELDIETGKIAEYSVPTQDAHPYGIVLADDGGLWFCELSGGKLGRVNPEDGSITEYMPSEKGTHPRRLVAVKGAIYFTDSGGGRLGRLTLADKKFKLWNSPSGSDSEPYGIAADSVGKIWYEESASSANKLVRFDPSVEVFRTYPMPAPNSSVRNMARDAKGRLWLPLSLANKIAVVE
jgi:virginiamycin B lyase